MANFCKGTINSVSSVTKSALFGLICMMFFREDAPQCAALCGGVSALINAYCGAYKTCIASDFDESIEDSGSLTPAQIKKIMRGWFGAGQAFGGLASLAGIAYAVS